MATKNILAWRNTRGLSRIGFLLAIIVLAFLAANFLPKNSEKPSVQASEKTQGVPTAEIAYQQNLNKVWIQGEGVVIKILPDDTQGSRHQRFILRLPSGQTLLVAHNIDLAPRLPDLRQGDHVRFQGEYIWNEKGGLIHWTHRKTSGETAGWLEKNGNRYE